MAFTVKNNESEETFDSFEQTMHHLSEDLRCELAKNSIETGILFSLLALQQDQTLLLIDENDNDVYVTRTHDIC